MHWQVLPRAIYTLRKKMIRKSLVSTVDHVGFLVPHSNSQEPKILSKHFMEAELEFSM